MEKLAGDLLLGLKFVKLEILSTSFIDFLYEELGELRSRSLGLEELTNIFPSRLVDDTYTLDEVTDMLDELCAVVRGEVDSELINSSHTNVLLLRQVFSQAEKWHLKLQADISELENR